MLKWSVKIRSQNETVKPLIIYCNGILRGQIGENTSSLSHFPRGSALGPGQVHQPRCGESFLCQSPKQKAVAALWTWEWRWGRGAEQIREGRARNTKVLNTGSEWRKNVFKVFPPSPRQEVSAEMPEKERLLPKSPNKAASEWRHVDWECKNVWEHSQSENWRPWLQLSPGTAVHGLCT